MDLFEVQSKLEELRAKRDALSKEASPLANRGDELTTGESEHFLRLCRGVEKLTNEIDPLENEWKRAITDGIASGSVTTERGDACDLGSSGPTLIRNSGAPWARLRSGQQPSVSELRGLAAGAVEVMRDAPDAGREKATQLLDRAADASPDHDLPELANHILRTSDPIYETAFRKFIRSPENPMLRMNRDEQDAFARVNESRAALSLSNAGALVPLTLDPTIMLTSSGAINPLRGISDVRTTLTDQWDGVSSAGVTAEWLAEATEAADATPTVAASSIAVHKAAAYVESSIEVSMDSNIGDQIGRLIADAKDTLEAAAFVTGTGSGQPFGIATRLAATTASRVAGSSGAAGAADFVVGDVYALQNALGPRFRPNASWLAEITTINRIRQFATGSGPQHAFIADLGAGQPPQLLGRPIYDASGMDSTIVSGSNDDVLIYGDFSQGFQIVDRVGLAIAFNPLVVGSNRRPTGSVGWWAFWRTGADVSVTNAFRMLRV